MILDWRYQMFVLDQISWSAGNQREYLPSTSWYIMEPFSSSVVQNTSLTAYPTQMADQYGVTPQDYVDDLKILSNQRYCQGMLFLYRLWSDSWNLFKPLLLLWWYMILLITFLNRWVFPFAKNDSTYLFSYRFNTSTGMFSIVSHFMADYHH